MSKAGQAGEPEVACCGLVCQPVCCHASTGCAGCRAGGGPDECRKRECCRERGIDGCWRCSSFPCAEGGFADEAWGGLCAGCVEMAGSAGPATFARLVVSRLGHGFDYGYLRYQTPEGVKAILRGEAEIPREDPDLRRQQRPRERAGSGRTVTTMSKDRTRRSVG